MSSTAIVVLSHLEPWLSVTTFRLSHPTTSPSDGRKTRNGAHLDCLRAPHHLARQSGPVLEPAFRDAARNARQRETDGKILGLEKSLLSTTRSALVTGPTSAR